MQRRLPDYLKRGLINTDKTKFVRNLLKEKCLNTVCEEARCPNKAECYAKNTATFMIMGDTCTRNCRFCAINSNAPQPLNKEEPRLVAEAINELKLNYSVITSVTRDDLPDGGATHFANTILEIKKISPNTKVEVLIPDFNGNINSLKIVIDAMPNVINHNMETVSSLYKKVRPQANYMQSLMVLDFVKNYNPNILTKTGIMVGLGETMQELTQLFIDLKNINIDILTIGQYIQPSKKHIPVSKYYTPEEFDELKKYALETGINVVISSPLVRSSYNAFEAFTIAKK